MSNRIPFLDTAKVICIFLMVVGHWTSNNNLLLYIYSFHMPALFVISGFLYKPRIWYKTILSLGIPVVFFSLINLLFLITIGEIPFNQLFSRDVFFRFFHYRQGLGDGLFKGDWFLWTLLGLRFFYGDIRLLSAFRKYYIPIALLPILYMSFESYLVQVDSIFRGYYFGRMIPSMPFFCVGFLLKDKKWDVNRIPILYLASFGLLFIILPIINGKSDIYFNIYGLSYILFFVNASISTIFIFAISSHIPPVNFVTTIAKGTLLILGMHMPIMNALNMILPDYFHEYIPLLILPICYYPILWLDKRCPILLGRIK